MNFAAFSEKHKGWVVGVSVAVLVVAGFFIFRSLTARSGYSRYRYFTTDDGKTWFAEGETVYPPIMHDGKEAVWVHVFRCDGNKVAGYLERMTAAAKANMAKPEGQRMTGPAAFATEVKKPGEGKWVSSGSPDGMRIAVPPCKPGGREIYP